MPRLRCTHKLLKLLGKEATKIAREDDSDESDLDWYANLFYVEGQECLIFTNVGTLVSFVALDVQRNEIEELLLIFRGRYRDLLGSLESTADQIEHELESFQNLSIGKSSNRKVLGSMNTHTQDAQHYVNMEGGLESVDQTALNAWLVRAPAGTPYVVPVFELAKRIPGLRSPSDFLNPDEQPPRNKLTEFLWMADCFAGDLGYFGLRGFLFAILTSPEGVLRSEWVDILLANDEPIFSTEDEARRVIDLLYKEYISVNQAILSGVGVRAKDCRLRDDAMANFDPSAPAGMWSRGFRFGFEWLSDGWDRAGTKEQVDYLRDIAQNLTFFGFRRLTIEELENQGLPESNLREMAEVARAHFHDSARTVAEKGRYTATRWVQATKPRKRTIPGQGSLFDSVDTVDTVVSVDTSGSKGSAGSNYIHAIDELSKRIPGLRTSSNRFRLDAASTSNKLTEFIRNADCLVSELGLYGLRGFLFAVVTSPEMVMPSEWTELLLAGDNSAFDSQDEAMEVLGLMHEEYNEINQAVLDGVGVRPEDCPFRDDVLSNFRGAPASEWSHGFGVGFEWLSEVWVASMPKDQLKTAREIAGVLAFFSSRHMVIEDLDWAGLPRSDLEKHAEMARDRFYITARSIAKIGRLATGLLKPGGVAALEKPAGIGKVGRNQPCPCGSGKKYKYCCGR